MHLPVINKFDCQHLLDEIELTYQDLSDALDLPYENFNPRLMRSILASLLEDVVYRSTDAKFRDPINITENLIKNYLNEEVRLDDIDIEDIQELFVQPLMDETKTLVNELLNKYDRYYSKWEVRESENFPTMEIVYKGDYRIDDWHRIHKVQTKAVVSVKKHYIRLRPMEDAIRDNIDPPGGIAINDVPMLIDKIIAYYVGKEVEELYKDLVLHIKNIHGFERNEESREALRMTKSIIKSIDSMNSVKAFKEDIELAEDIYSSLTRTSVVFDLIMPGNSDTDMEARRELLEKIDKQGYVEKDIAGLVESICG